MQNIVSPLVGYRQDTITLAVCSGVTRISCNKPIAVQNKELASQRGHISSFSAKSRKRLIEFLFSLESLPRTFLTLTYPKYFPADSVEWKRHLNLFATHIRQRFPKAWFVWKLEPQRRGAPHYHLVGDFGTDVDRSNIQQYREYIARLWFEIVGTGYPEHLKAGTQVKLIDTRKIISIYVSKYVAKIQDNDLQSWETPGRFWGYIGKENMPKKKEMTFVFTVAGFQKLKRALLKRFKNMKNLSRKFFNYVKGNYQYSTFIERSEMLRLINFYRDEVLINEHGEINSQNESRRFRSFFRNQRASYCCQGNN